MSKADGRIFAAAGAVATLVLVAVGVLAAGGTGPARPAESPAAPGGRAAQRARRQLLGTGRRQRQDDLARPASEQSVRRHHLGLLVPGLQRRGAHARGVRRRAPEAAFVGVNFQDSESAARDFHERYGWRFPSVFDPDGAIAYELRLQGTPTTIFLDSDHREAVRVVGETDAEGFAEGLAAATSS